jgi:predicted TIM-barrel fold metal-dependent hydrolase
MYLDATDARDLAGILAEWEAGAKREASGARDWIGSWCAGLAAEGYVGLKFAVSLPVDCIDDDRAEDLFLRLRSGDINDPEARELGVWMMHAAIRGAPDHGLVVAVHCGLNWEVNLDLLSRNPVRITPLLMRFTRTVFDLYHGGIPWVREMAAIGNQYPNAHLNLCWCHQISPKMTEAMLAEWIDMVPANKIIGFGGDVSTSPYKIYGALCLAKENIAGALAARARRGEMSLTRAEEICRMWLYENPRRIYRI